jgi:hypothetical protein
VRHGPANFYSIAVLRAPAATAPPTPSLHSLNNVVVVANASVGPSIELVASEQQ